jgi:hypothetical protein
MRRTRIAAILASSLAIVALGAGASSARPATPSTLTLTASVVDQVCQGGDFVNVTLTATAESSSGLRGFKWDFTNNGTFDTQKLRNPMVTHQYTDETNVTARVGAKNAEGDQAMDTVTFSTLDCP